MRVRKIMPMPPKRVPRSSARTAPRRCNKRFNTGFIERVIQRGGVWKSARLGYREGAKDKKGACNGE